MSELNALADGETGSDPDGETHHLKSTIAALRQALEDGEAERNSVRQTVRAAYEGEFAELKATITALRDALEESRHEGRGAAERALAHSAAEIAQLRQTAQALRDAIEGLRHEHRRESNASPPPLRTRRPSSTPRPALCGNGWRRQHSRPRPRNKGRRPSLPARSRNSRRRAKPCGRRDRRGNVG